MTNFNYECDFELQNEEQMARWITFVIQNEGFNEGEINYIFCDDEYLLKLNVEFLNHDTLTDIISFDYTLGKEINGEVYISIERVKDNSNDYKVDFDTELMRVMIHGILHYCGFKDKTETDEKIMRSKEKYYMKQMA